MAVILKTLNLFHNRFLTSTCTSKLTYLNLQNSIRTLKSEINDKLYELNIPEKPKKPLTPYLQFVCDNQDIVAKENPHLKQAAVISKCAEKWRASAELEKDKYIQKFKSESEVYHDDILRYNAKLTAEQVAALRAVDSEKRRKRKLRKTKKLSKEYNKPKRPMNAYVLFLNEQRLMRNLDSKLLFKTVKGEWQKLPDCEKQKYTDMFLKEREKYEIDLLEWEKKRFAEGLKELIRPKTVKFMEDQDKKDGKSSRNSHKNEKCSE